MPHPNAKLTLSGKHVLVDRVLHQGMSVAQASYMLGVSRATGFKWLRRSTPTAMPFRRCKRTLRNGWRGSDSEPDVCNPFADGPLRIPI